jgi:hypothetical protein
MNYWTSTGENGFPKKIERFIKLLQITAFKSRFELEIGLINIRDKI